jgi:hypothetical protein
MVHTNCERNNVSAVREVAVALREACNTPVLSLHFPLALHEHEHVNCILNVT